MRKSAGPRFPGLWESVAHRVCEIVRMSEAFDPYHTWLGISPHEQPAHYYRLLGIGLFESDPAVIAGAADRQMAYVRTFQSGPRGHHTQKLLNELAAARLCLLDSQERTAYDTWLRDYLASRTHAITRPAPPPQATVAPPPFTAPPFHAPSAPPVDFARLPPGKAVASPRASEPEESAVPEKATSPWFWAFAALVSLLSGGAVVALIVALVNRRSEPVAVLPPGDTPSVVKPEKPATPETPAAPRVVETEQEGNGDVVFTAIAAQREGETSILESGETSALDGLYGATDKARWNFKVAKPGFFRVVVSYAAEADSAGGRFRISVGDKGVEGTVRDSGGAGSVANEQVGILLVQKSGRHILELAPLSVSGKRLMLLHSIRLVLRP